MLLKRLAPRSLYARFLLIIIIPTVLAQVVAAYMFYERHWSSVSRNISASLAGEISYVIDVLEKTPKKEHQAFLKDMDEFLKLKVKFQDKSVPQATLGKPSERFHYFENSLKEYLEYNFYIVDLAKNAEILLVVSIPDGKLLVTMPRKRLVNPTTSIFMFWMVGASLILLTVAILFLRNQLRAIIRLSEAADKFGRGENIEHFKPHGATEVRQAAQAFLDMKERINRHIRQRTEMLAGVSHDLRTPLTRMKLQIAMMEKTDKVKELERDVVDMEHMVEGYLDFVRGGADEATEQTHISTMLRLIKDTYTLDSKRITVDLPYDVVLPLRRLAFKRAVTNLVDNALRHGKNVKISGHVADAHLVLDVEDDGPGIPENKYEAVFMPFVRLDESRNLDKGGVGLGLTIARDIILAHGGKISLGKSTMGGLKVSVSVPV